MGLPERVWVQRRLAGLGSQVEERIVAAVSRAVPAYTTISPAQLAEARAISAWATRRLIEMWVDGSAITEADLRRFHGIGVARATDGRPLLAVLRAYRVAAVEISDLIVELAPPGLSPADVVALNRALLTSIDQLSEALFAGYTNATEQLNSNRAQMLTGLANDLLTGRQTSAAVLADRAAQLAITVPAVLTLAVVTPATSTAAFTDGDVADLAASISSAGSDDSAQVLHTRRGRHGALLSAALPGLAGELAFRKWRACLVRDCSPAALPFDFRLAAGALEHAPDEAYGDAPVLDRSDAMLVGLLRGEPPVDPAQFAATVLGAVTRAKNAHLLEGLQAYLRHGSSTSAAVALGLHPQTMRHRLRRLTELTGRDLRRSWDRLMLDTARTCELVARPRA